MSFCPACGWWRLTDRHVRWGTGNFLASNEQIDLAYAELCSLSLCDIGIPLQTCREEIISRPAARFEVAPRRLEEIVEGVFGDFGFATELTAPTCDGGFDVFLREPSGEIVGVEVKRYRNPIGVGQIRALVGAMVVGDIPKGIFVTTSEFSKASRLAATMAGHRGRPVELVDGGRLLDYLRIAQIKRRGKVSAQDLGVDLKSVRTQSVYFEQMKG